MGITNNNPGNIRHGDKWQGLAPQQSGEFCTFVSPAYGIRAMMVILSNYAKKTPPLTTINAIISAWAPPEENDTASYIADVSKRMGIKPTDNLVHPKRNTQGGTKSPSLLTYADDMGTLTSLCKAIIWHENGKQPYTDSVFAEAQRLLTNA